MTCSVDSKRPQAVATSASRVCTVVALLGVVMLSAHSGWARSVDAPATAENSGRLGLLQVLQDGKDGVEGLVGPAFLAPSPDGASVYATSYYGHSVAVFARDARTGGLSFVQAVRSGADGVRGVLGARGVVVSPDGAHLWTANRADKSIALFSRDVATGGLGFVEVRRDVVPDWIGMGDVDVVPAVAPGCLHRVRRVARSESAV